MPAAQAAPGGAEDLAVDAGGRSKALRGLSEDLSLALGRWRRWCRQNGEDAERYIAPTLDLLADVADDLRALQAAASAGSAAPRGAPPAGGEGGEAESAARQADLAAGAERPRPRFRVSSMSMGVATTCQ